MRQYKKIKINANMTVLVCCDNKGKEIEHPRFFIEYRKKNDVFTRLPYDKELQVLFSKMNINELRSILNASL